jgi:hypothetical protein
MLMPMLIWQSCGSVAAAVAEAEHAHAAEEIPNTKGDAYLGALIATFVVSIASVAGVCFHHALTHTHALFGQPRAMQVMGPVHA